MNINAIGRGIVDDLRSNLTDPINRGTNWIHYDSPSDVGKTPAIFVELSPSPRHDEYVGGGQNHFLNWKIHVAVKDKDQGISVTGGSVILTDTSELRDDIVQGVINRLESSMVAISGAKTIGLTNISGLWPIAFHKEAVTLDYEVEAVE